MNNPDALQSGSFDRLKVDVFENHPSLGQAAAKDAISILRAALEQRDEARVIVATGNSQDEVIRALTADQSIDWSRITVFHMDEYAGISAEHPASFRRWLRTRVADIVHPRAVLYLDGDAADVQRECERYGNLLQERPIDICFVGIGENGHIAFNDPHVADFRDPLTVKQVRLDDACRRQQVGEGHFLDIDAVPTFALTITCPVIMSCAHLVCCVPDLRKARAVRSSLLGPVDAACPGSILRTHQCAKLYLDRDSASLINSELAAAR